MTKEEAIKFLEKQKNFDEESIVDDAIDIAIEALEVEPVIWSLKAEIENRLIKTSSLISEVGYESLVLKEREKIYKNILSTMNNYLKIIEWED